MKWLKNGDGNNKFFYNSCKNRWNINKVLYLEDDLGVVHNTHDSISNVVVSYYENVFSNYNNVTSISEDITLQVLSESQALDLLAPFSSEDISRIFKSMAKNRSPSPDGFTSEFFMATWSIIGSDVVKGIRYFFIL